MVNELSHRDEKQRSSDKVEQDISLIKSSGSDVVTGVKKMFTNTGYYLVLLYCSTSISWRLRGLKRVPRSDLHCLIQYHLSLVLTVPLL